MLSPGVASQEVLRFIGTEFKALGAKRMLLPVAPLAPLPRRDTGRKASMLETVENARAEVQRECMQLLPTFQAPYYNSVYAKSGGEVPHRWMSLFIEPVPHVSSSPPSAAATAAAAAAAASMPQPELRTQMQSYTDQRDWTEGALHELTTAYGVPAQASMALHSSFYERKEAAFKLRIMLPVSSFSNRSTGSGSGQRGSICLADVLTESGGQTTKVVRPKGRPGRGGGGGATWLSPNDTSTFKQSRG